MAGFEFITRESHTWYSIVSDFFHSVLSSESLLCCVAVAGLCSLLDGGGRVGSTVDGRLGRSQDVLSGSTLLEAFSLAASGE